MCYKGQLPKIRNALQGVQNEIENTGGSQGTDVGSKLPPTLNALDEIEKYIANNGATDEGAHAAQKIPEIKFYRPTDLLKFA